LTTSADQARASLGIRLRDIRRDAGLPAVRLAELAGWLSSKVSKIEHGKQTHRRRICGPGASTAAP